MKFEFTESQYSNLLILLDRVEVKGFKEVQVFNEIMNILNSPIKENQVDSSDEKK